LLKDWQSESADAEVPNIEALEFFYEACADGRREFSYGEGVTLSTVHSAKGAEYGHVVLAGTWPLGRDRAANEEQRRTFYVGMTRARKSLGIIDNLNTRPSLPAELTGPAILVRAVEQPSQPRIDPWLNYSTLGLDDIYLDYPSSYPAESEIHQHLNQLNPGDRLSMRLVNEDRIGLFDNANVCVARLSRHGVAEWQSRIDTIREIRVLAMVCRSLEQEIDEAQRELGRVAEWEVPIVEVVTEEG